MSSYMKCLCVCSYVERYDLSEPSDDIQQVLKRIAVKLGKTQRVKAITGVGKSKPYRTKYIVKLCIYISTLFTYNNLHSNCRVIVQFLQLLQGQVLASRQIFILALLKTFVS